MLGPESESQPRDDLRETLQETIGRWSGGAPPAIPTCNFPYVHVGAGLVQQVWGRGGRCLHTWWRASR